MKRWHCLMLLACLGLGSCEQDKTAGMVGRVYGYKPIYGNSADLFTISNKPVQPVLKAGKIYTKDNFIFQNEIGEGIHVIDNSNPANAQRVGFIRIKGSEEISIKGNFLYSNNYNDLVVVNITNISAVSEVKRIKNAFHSNKSEVPPINGSYFECVEPAKGTVVGWAADSITNPKCRN